MKKSVRVYLSLGTNLGDRAAHLRAALESLRAAPGVRVLSCSSFYETAPVGVTEQPAFLNAAAALETTLEPLPLLHLLKDMESRLGRMPGPRWGPRSLDMDILLYGNLVLETPELILPHPRMHERRFVLEPLCEIAPEAEHPVLHKNTSSLLAECTNKSSVRRITP